MSTPLIRPTWARELTTIAMMMGSPKAHDAHYGSGGVSSAEKQSHRTMFISILVTRSSWSSLSRMTDHQKCRIPDRLTFKNHPRVLAVAIVAAPPSCRLPPTIDRPLQPPRSPPGPTIIYGMLEDNEELGVTNR